LASEVVAIQKSLFVRYALKIYTFSTAIFDIGSAKPRKGALNEFSARNRAVNQVAARS